MSAQDAKPIPLRDQPEMPGYFGMDRMGRDEFLSQVGHFSEEQRTLFSLLCDMWEPDIPYAKFLTKARHDHMNAEPALNAIMSQLERGKCGLIVCSAGEDRLEKSRVILTERDSPRFWYWSVENAWHRAQADESLPFPALGDFSHYESFPNDSLEPLSLADISESFVRGRGSEVRLYTLSDLTDSPFILTPSSVFLMVQACRRRLRSILANSALQPLLSRLLGTVVSDLRRSLLKNDHSFWSSLTDVIGAHREDLKARKPNLSEELFIAATILKAYNRNELNEAERRREEDAEKRDVMKSILVHLAGYDGFLISKQDMQAQFRPYEDRWPDFYDTFVSYFMAEGGSSTLPAVMSIGDEYIHRDRIYPLFKLHYEQAADELHDFYRNSIERMLIGGAGSRTAVFAGLEAFRGDIEDRLSADFPVLERLLALPKIVSEGIIHYAGKVLKIQDMQRIKNVLQRYFDGSTLHFKDPERLFGLSPRAMFDEAFEKLGGFRRLILKLFGRYDGLMQLFNQSLSPRGGARKPSSSSVRRSAGGEARTEPAEAPGSELRGSGDGHGPRRPSVSERPRRAKNTPAGYTVRQRNAAWSQFRDAYKRTKNGKD